MTLETGLIAPNIRLTVLQTYKFKTGVLTLTLPFALTREHALLTLLLPGVLRRGTKKYPTMAALNKRLDDLYASCIEIRSARLGQSLQLILTAEMLDDRFTSGDISVSDGVIEVLAETVLRPNLCENGAFPKQIVDQEIRFTKDSVRGIINNTRVYASTRLREMLNKNDPTNLTVEETLDLLDSANANQLASLHCEICTGAPLDVFYVGSLSFADLSKKILAHFGTWSHASAVPCGTLEPSVSNVTSEQTEKMPVSQGKLALGFRTGTCLGFNDKENYSMLVFNEIFGGSPASKLFMNVREKMGLCYYCSSSYSQYTGIITVSAGVETKNLTIAKEAILRQLEDIRHGKISDTELHAAKISLENAYQQINDNPFDLQSFYGNRIQLGLSCSLEESCRAIASVTREDVIRVAEKVLLDSVFMIEGNGDVEEEDSDDE